MKRIWNTDELVEFFTLTPKDFELISTKSRATRLGFSVLLKYFQIETRFPIMKSEVPFDIVRFISNQLAVPFELFKEYDFNGRSCRYHKSQLREYFEFRETTNDDNDFVTEWLYKNFECYDKEKVKTAAYQKFRELKIEPPSTDRIDRIAVSAISSFEKELFCKIYKSIPQSSIENINQLIQKLSSYDEQDELKDTITFNKLRSDPCRIGIESVFHEIEKLRTIMKLNIPDDIFQKIPFKILKKYKQRISSELLVEIRRHPESIKYSLLAIFFWLRSRDIIDNLVELLIQIIHRIDSKAVKKVDKELLKDIKKVHGKHTILRKLAELSIQYPEGIIKDVIFPSVDKNILTDLVKELKINSNTYRGKVYTVMKNSYSRHYRRMLPELLEILDFRSNNDIHKPVIEAIEIIKQHIDSKIKYLTLNESIPVSGVIKPKWEKAVVQKDQNGQDCIEKINYEICVLQALREKLRCKEIWVAGANKYRNPEKDLPDDFETKRKEYYDALKQPDDVETFIDELQKNMREALTKFNKNLPENSKVKTSSKKGGRIILSPSDPQQEPLNLSALKGEIMKKWPMVNLLDILKETDLLVNFTDNFKSSGAREVLERETIQRRLLITLFALGTNTGLKRIAKATNNPDSFDDLRYIKRKFINKDNLRNAIVSVANSIFNIRMNNIWGEGTTNCASDSKKFGAWDQNLMTEWHIRYRGRGVMIYWHVEKKSTCIYSQLKSCSSSEVAAMIEGILKHCTDMKIDKNYVDTHGQSEVAFAFSHLLNFSLMPRFKNINRQKLYLPDSEIKSELPNLEHILTRNIDWNLIREQYDQMIKYTTALRLGTAETEAIMKRFTRNNLQHPTYKALQELGKVVKTIFLCEYLMSEELRIEINEGLNVVENWNSANGFIFYGKSSEIQSNNIADQEISVLCLHLLQICLVYVNTLMIQEILSENDWLERMEAEDYRALTPLIYQHVNPYGNFYLDMRERLPLKINE